MRARRKLNHALARQPHLRSSSSFLRQRAITRSVVSVDLAEARRRRVLTIRELGWTPMEDWSKELAEDESAELAAASDKRAAALASLRGPTHAALEAVEWGLCDWAGVVRAQN